LAKKSGKRIFEVEIAVTSFFGVDEGNDLERINRGREIASYLANSWDKSDEATTGMSRKKFLKELIDWIRGVGITASGEHRFTPLALAVVNLFRGGDLMDPRHLGRMARDDPAFRWMTETNLLYANPFSVELPWIPLRRPIARLPHAPVIPPGRPIRWLDIGSAPKADGSPTLNLLARTFKRWLPEQRFEFIGTDIAFPPWVIRDGKIERFKWDAIDEPTNRFTLHGIHFWDARNPVNDIGSPQFLSHSLDDQFDFISMCAVIHHFGMGQPANSHCLDRDSTGPIRWVEDNGQDIDAPAFDLITEKQKKAINNALRHLNPEGGIFFFYPTLHYETGEVGEDLYWVIQREGENSYRLLSNGIPLRPDTRRMESEKCVMNGSHDERFKNPGFEQRYPEWSAAAKTELGRWLHRADLLVFRYQRRGNGIWAGISRLAARMNDSNASLRELFEAYLALIPASEHRKAKLLSGVERFESDQLRFRSDPKRSA
jgi:hypothetical protein